MKTLLRWLALGFGIGMLVALAPSCGPKPCGAGSCPGCCDSTGTCQGGTSPTACGVNGGACTSCATAPFCQAGLCSGGTGGGGGGTGGGGGGIGTVTLESYCNDFADIWCTQLTACNRTEASFKAECVTYLKKSFCGGTLAVSLAKGYRTFDSAKAAACLNESRTASASCGGSMYSADSPSCSKVFVSNSGTGGGCLDTADCKVKGNACAGTGCAKTCQPTGALGQPCIGGFNCNTGAWCDQAANLCKAPRPAGSPCTSNYSSECDTSSYCDTTLDICTALPGNNQPCSTNYPQCSPATYCDYASTPSTCRTNLVLGATCSSSSACGTTAYCNYSVSPSICTVRKAAGSACSSGTECQDQLNCKAGLCVARAGEGGVCSSYGDCASNLSCDDISRTCQTYRGVDLGGTCTGTTQYCSSSRLTCRGSAKNPDGGVGTVGTCQTTVVGDTCSSSTYCPPGTYCAKTPADAGTGSCQGSSLGTPCSDDDHCLAVNYCAGTACAARIAAGGVCSDTSSCVTPLSCKLSSPSTGVCGEPGATGAPCLDGSFDQCKVPNECVAGICTVTMVLGARCSSYGMCLSGACQGMNPDAGVAGTCGPLLADNAACRIWSDCESQRCEAGKCAAPCP
ncbi:MAG: hypothetical protein ACYC8T_05410 [Myxococcaceae bacterium]